MNFADDTVIYVEGKNKHLIEDQLNEDLQCIASYLLNNELVINLKKGKTEAMIFGTAKRLTKCGKDLSLQYNGEEIQNTESYKYLGTILDSSLSMSTNFDKMYKKTMSKLRMLFSLRNYLDKTTMNKIFRGMILPCVTFNCTVNLNLSQTQLQKLQSIDKLATKLTGTNQTPVANEIKKRSILLVRKCLENKVCENFNGYFNMISHDRGTRNNGCMLKIPSTKLQYAKTGFFCMGAKHYNELPIEIRKTENFNDFKKKVFNLYN